MKIFLSWSSERSRLLAFALRDWLPLVLHYAKPWVSERDIAAGDRWALEVGKGLEEAGYGIICLTRENLEAPWLLFEAGALSRSLMTSSVCPYLLDLEFSEISGPLSQFQAKKAERSTTLEMIEAINVKATEPIGDGRLQELFELTWPKLNIQLQKIPPAKGAPKAKRSQPEILEELVVAVRGMEQRFRTFELKTSVGTGVGRRIDTRSSKPASVAVLVDEDAGRFVRGDDFSMPVRGPHLVNDIAIFVGIDVEAFGNEWYLADHHTSERLSREECEGVLAYFGDKTPILRLTRSPF